MNKKLQKEINWWINLIATFLGWIFIGLSAWKVIDPIEPLLIILFIILVTWERELADE